MNRRQLEKLGVPPDCVKDAIRAIQTLVETAAARRKDVKTRIKRVLESPHDYVGDESLAPFAKALIEDREFVRAAPVSYRTWGPEGIDEQSHQQMRRACSVPVATAAALMPDAHLGYGLPIGGVLACENAVIPYAVGVDIACRMKLSVLDMPCETI